MVLQTYERIHTKPGRMKSDASCGSRVGYWQAPHFSFISTFKIIMSIFLMVKTKNKKGVENSWLEQGVMGYRKLLVFIALSAGLYFCLRLTIIDERTSAY